MFRPSRALCLARANTFRLLLSLAIGGCVQFNNHDLASSDLIGLNEIDFDLRNHMEDGSESAIGNLVTDAMMAYVRHRCKNDREIPCADFALLNSGAIRRETNFGTRNKLGAGPIYESDIRYLLPFGNSLVVVRLLGKDIKLILEHSASKVDLPNSAIYASHFLQVSGITFEIDSTADPENLTANGQQIDSLGQRVDNIRITSGDVVKKLELDQYYEVATTSYLAQGKDGFIAFLQLDSENRVINNNGQPVPKYVPEKDTILGHKGSTKTSCEATLWWFKQQRIAQKTIQRPQMGRIF